MSDKPSTEQLINIVRHLLVTEFGLDRQAIKKQANDLIQQSVTAAVNQNLQNDTIPDEVSKYLRQKEYYIKEEVRKAAANIAREIVDKYMTIEVKTPPTT